MTRALPSLSPLQIKVASNSVLVKLIVKLLEVLVNVGWISSAYVDRSQTEYADMIKDKKNVDVVDKYDVAKDRINNFYMKAFNEWHNHLYEVESFFVVKHENTRVECGFSIYSEIIVSQTIVYEGIIKEVGLMKVKISNEMIMLVGFTKSTKWH